MKARKSRSTRPKAHIYREHRKGRGEVAEVNPKVQGLHLCNLTSDLFNRTMASTNSQSRTQSRRFLVRGRVQGVGFRWFVEREAVILQVAGWARHGPAG